MPNTVCWSRAKNNTMLAMKIRIKAKVAATEPRQLCGRITKLKKVKLSQSFMSLP